MSFLQSKHLFEQTRNLIPGGVNSPERAFGQVCGSPIFFLKGYDSRFLDVDGNVFTDFCMSSGPLILGHAHPKVIEDVQEAVKDGLVYDACHSREVQLAEILLAAFPEFDKVRMVNSGTEAVMTALRIARNNTGRSLTVKFEGCYHGHFDAMLGKTGSIPGKQDFESANRVSEIVASTTIVLPLDDEEAVKTVFESHGQDIAAVIIEPLPAHYGLLIQRPEFLEFLREITKKNGSLLIFDEITSGFRLKFGGYGQIVGIQPDLVILGKIIGGGMPVGAIVGPAQFMDELAPLGSVYQSCTFNGNPVSLAAGISTLEILQDDPPYEYLENLAQGFGQLLAGSEIPWLRACWIGSIVWLYMDTGEFPRKVDAVSAKAVERLKSIHPNLLSLGMYVPPSPWQVMFLSIAHQNYQLEGLYTFLLNECMELN